MDTPTKLGDAAATSTLAELNSVISDATLVDGGGLTSIADSGSDAEVQDGNLLWATDGAGNIGANADNRPAVIYTSSNLFVGGDIYQRGANGGYVRLIQTEWLQTINAATYTDAAYACPVGAVIRGCHCRVTVQPPGTSTFNLGDVAAPTRFGTGISSAATTTNVAMVTPTLQVSGQYIRVTPNATPSDNTGRIRICLFYDIGVAPQS